MGEPARDHRVPQFTFADAQKVMLLGVERFVRLEFDLNVLATRRKDNGTGELVRLASRDGRRHHATLREPECHKLSGRDLDSIRNFFHGSVVVRSGSTIYCIRQQSASFTSMMNQKELLDKL